MSHFNLRVYGLCINAQQQVLLSDEFEYGMQFTKFPGGGVEHGEGLIDALKREFREECFVEIDVLSHFYTTDFYEKSVFNDSQLISVYYIVEPTQPLALPFKQHPFDFDNGATQSFRWMPISQLESNSVTFKTDQTVVALLKRRYAHYKS